MLMASRPAVGSTCSRPARIFMHRSPGRRMLAHAATAPRGALLYPRLSREGLEGRFLGLMAYLDGKPEGNNSMVRREALHRIPCGAGRNLVGCFWV